MDARDALIARWLETEAPHPAAPLLIVAPHREAAREVSRLLPGPARFGHHRTHLVRLAAALAERTLCREGRVPVGALAAGAVVARALHALRDDPARLRRFAPVAGTPGFVSAAAATLAELRMERSAVPEELSGLAAAYDDELARAGLADRACVFQAALAAVRDPASRHPWLDVPTLSLDVPVRSALEAELLAAVAARARGWLATVPAGDGETRRRLSALGVAARETPPAGQGCLARLQRDLFPEADADAEAGAEAEAADAEPDESLVVVSAPGESRECVELARRVLREARGGVPFDRMAVWLRSPDEYRPHLAEALHRAGVPVFFARGTVQPDPTGRAFVALLACAAEGLSASRFAEYLSLGEVPARDAHGAPPPASPPEDAWVAPDEEMLRETLAPPWEAAAGAEGAPRGDEAEDVPGSAGDGGPGEDTALPVPRRWERLLVDAAVIGGRERWVRRIAGLAAALDAEAEARALEDGDSQSPRAAQLERARRELASLRAFALPLLDALEALPEAAPWGGWLDALSGLATRALRRPERVLAVLAELRPLGETGPVTLSEVRAVLARRLLELPVPPAERRHGRLFVAPCEAARGMAGRFEVAFVPGLAERLFPRKLHEDPLLLDAARAPLGLPRQDERIQRERLALRLAVATARRRVVLSYPRLDVDQGRPRVPSFYALEAVRAATGRLPDFEELRRSAEEVSDARIGWPAPARPDDAIDDAEHDLALLQGLLEPAPEGARGTARYLVETNPHLGRALRFRARRWGVRAWTVADGLVAQEGVPLASGAREAMADHALAARSFSPTALQHYAACPYRFFLYAVHRLSPREVPEAIDEMDPLQKGSLVHEVQFRLFGRLRDAGLLPVTPGRLGEARAVLDEVLPEVAARWREELAPAIERVFAAGIEDVRADLREWLRRLSEDASGFVPWRFELAFGLGAADPGERDPESRAEAVGLDCGLRLRGSIDLVERAADGRVRVTDHKTGRDRVAEGAVVGGGEALQPVLYALAAEKLFPGAEVVSGRLSYCTSAGGFREREVPLDGAARAAAAQVAEAVDRALSEPFLPALPKERGCRWCDYRPVCGPYEELRTRAPRKWHGHAEVRALEALRKLP